MSFKTNARQQFGFVIILWYEVRREGQEPRFYWHALTALGWPMTLHFVGLNPILSTSRSSLREISMTCLLCSLFVYMCFLQFRAGSALLKIVLQRAPVTPSILRRPTNASIAVFFFLICSIRPLY